MENRRETVFDVVVVGGGPAGATAARDLARKGHSVALLDRAGRIKPCGGAIPPRLIRDFDIPESQIVARSRSARMISPNGVPVDMPIDGGYVGMVDREHFDEWLRVRSAEAGAERLTGSFTKVQRHDDGTMTVQYRTDNRQIETVKARMLIGADGARSEVAKQEMPDEQVPFVFAYHEIVESPPESGEHFDPQRCDVFYQGKHSPDFYSWIFPHGSVMSIGTGTANKGFSLRSSISALREATGLSELKTVRTEGAPIPLKPRKRWDNGRDVLLIGDAAGVVAPASGEGIYYAMLSGELGAKAVDLMLQTARAKHLRLARRLFMRGHGRIFWVLGIMQRFWYTSDKRRERFVSICRDPDVQRLTWEAYMNKRLVRARPLAHVRIFFKDLAHLLGLAPVR